MGGGFANPRFGAMFPGDGKLKRRRVPRMIGALCSVAAFASARAEAICRETIEGAARYVVCEADPSRDEIRLFLSDGAGAPYADFGPLADALAARGETLLFAMNAGMYREDRSPVGLYIENGEEKRALSTRDGPGNFHLKPNGVFWIDADGAAHVTATDDYREKAAAFATQSGPMLVIDGAIHARFLPDSDSRKRRNGVGVRKDGIVVFAISDTPVTFHEFAAFFRDALLTPNALYLDGRISRLYAPAIGRFDPGVRMGPIVGVVERAE